MIAMRTALALLVALSLFACAGQKPKPEAKPCAAASKWGESKWDECPTEAAK